MWQQFNEKLGSGAYKEVWAGYDTQEGLEVAWNTVRFDGSELVGRRTRL
jgi:hypothetical protein